jgi:hypothetical protein
MAGECHLGETVPFFSKKLEIFKDQGYEYLAIEADHRLKPLIDKYCADKITKEMLFEEGEKISPLNFNFPHYFPLVEEAKKLGMKVLPIDNNLDDFTENEYESAKFTKDAGQIKDLLHVRDMPMFERLNEQVFSQKPDAKVVVYGGMAHFHKKSGENCKNEPLRNIIDILTDKKACSVFLTDKKDVSQIVNLKNPKSDTGFSTQNNELSDYAMDFDAKSFRQPEDRYSKYGDDFEGIVII